MRARPGAHTRGFGPGPGARTERWNVDGVAVREVQRRIHPDRRQLPYAMGESGPVRHQLGDQAP
ncbi:hypothetical protein ACFV8Z_35905 [Streptomyces sp. NPDC059837]|uniref:hypothetical protein n=1 Tax=Streptomyces sp. NPDC059837 TaxID=3346968 RepID=UPI00364A993E